MEAQGEDMDTTPVAPAPLLFTIDTSPSREMEGGRREDEKEEEGALQTAEESREDDGDIGVVCGKAGKKGKMKQEREETKIVDQSASEESSGEEDEGNGDGQQRENGIGWSAEAPPLQLGLIR